MAFDRARYWYRKRRGPQRRKHADDADSTEAR